MSHKIVGHFFIAFSRFPDFGGEAAEIRKPK